MKQEVVTFTQSLTHPVSVSFTCEHCGEVNTFIHEIIGVGNRSGGKRGADGKYVMSPKDSIIIMEQAQKNLELGIKKVERKVEKGNYSWLEAKKCSKCQHYQSWNGGRIWKDFFMLFLGGPFIIFLVIGFPITMIYKNTTNYPSWVYVLIGGLSFIIMVGALINLVSSLNMKSRKNRNVPTVFVR